MSANINEIIKTLARGDLVIMRSDTVYGVFASALDKRATEKLRIVRERDVKRGFIILVDSVETIARLIQINNETSKRLAAIWRTDAPTSVILPANGLKETWLADTRGTESTICFRVPNNEKLRKLLVKTGPLLAPSANPPGEPLARNIAEAQAYFGDAVSLYVDGGECVDVAPSRIIAFDDYHQMKIIRSDGRDYADNFVLSRRRKLYKFAKFDEYPNCFHLDKWKEFFAGSFLAKEKDIVLEVGAGSALFSVELARRFPEKTFIAVDIKSDRLYQGARETEKLELDNIYFVRSDIAKINEIAPPHSVSEIWLTFPDPWPPKSGARHRLTAPRYLAYYRELLSKENGILHFKTDDAPLFEWSLEQFKENHWQSEFITCDLHSSDASDEAKITTNYEKRFMAEGLKISYAQFR